MAKQLNIGNSTISNYETGYSTPDSEMIKKIADFFGVSTDYLLGRTDIPDLEPHNSVIRKREGVMAKMDSQKPENAIEKVLAQLVMVPVLGNIRAGQPLFAEEQIKGYWPAAKEMMSPGYEHFFLEVEGNSMTGDNIDNGDYVLIRVQNYIDYEGQIAAVIINGNEACLKHVYHPANSNMIILRSSNPAYADIVHPADDVIVNGVYAGVFKKPKH